MLPVGHSTVSQRLTASRSVSVMLRNIDCEPWPGGSSPGCPGRRLDRTTAPTAAIRGNDWGFRPQAWARWRGFGRRLAALTVDWFIGYGIAAIFATPDPAVNPWFGWLVLGVWFVLTAVPVAVFGASAGKMALGLRVASVDGHATVGVGRALLRTALIAVVAPPLVRDVDGRGWHDRAARTVVVRTRP